MMNDVEKALEKFFGSIPMRISDSRYEIISKNAPCKIFFGTPSRPDGVYTVHFDYDTPVFIYDYNMEKALGKAKVYIERLVNG